MDTYTEKYFKEILEKIGEEKASIIMEITIKRVIQSNILEMSNVNCLKDIKKTLDKRIKELE